MSVLGLLAGCNITTCPDPRCMTRGACQLAAPPLVPCGSCAEICEFCGPDDPRSRAFNDDAPEIAAGHEWTTQEFADAVTELDSPTADDVVNPKTLMGARRVDISLLPAAGIIHGSHAMMDGAAKYNPYNWREKKVPARTYISAAMRHLLDYLDGEETAADSGVHHLGHVIGCCAIVLDAMETGNLIDDRPTKGTAAAILARLEKALTTRGAK